MKTREKIDWLSLSFDDVESIAYPDWWPQEKVEAKAFNGYQRARKYSDGRLEMYSPDRPDMGVHVVMSGDTLDNLAGIGTTELVFLRDAGARFGRLDVALDVFDSRFSVNLVGKEIKHERAITDARVFPTNTSNGTEGKTQYIGRKSSNKYARVYDKAYEQKVDMKWIRIEAVFQKRLAGKAVEAYINGASVRSLIKSVIDCPEYPTWEHALSGDLAATLELSRKIGQTKEWLLHCAAPSLARELYLDGDESFLFEFNRRVKDHYEKISGRKSV